MHAFLELIGLNFNVSAPFSAGLVKCWYFMVKNTKKYGGRNEIHRRHMKCRRAAYIQLFDLAKMVASHSYALATKNWKMFNFFFESCKNVDLRPQPAINHWVVCGCFLCYTHRACVCVYIYTLKWRTNNLFLCLNPRLCSTRWRSVDV